MFSLIIGISLIAMFISGILCDAKWGRGKVIIIGSKSCNLLQLLAIQIVHFSLGFPLCLLGFILLTMTASGNTFLCHINEPAFKNATSLVDEKCAPAILVTFTLM